MEEARFVVPFPLFLSSSAPLILSRLLCARMETSILEAVRAREGEKRERFLVVCLSLPRHGAPETVQARRAHTHIHTYTYFLAATEENSLALCCTENPTFPQSERQVDSWVLR